MTFGGKTAGVLGILMIACSVPIPAFAAEGKTTRWTSANLPLEKIPADVLASDEGKLLQSVADRNVYQIVHLIYRSKNYEVQSKDYEFSRTSMIDHWNAGYNDAVRTLRHPEALQRPVNGPGVGTFDMAVDGRE